MTDARIALFAVGKRGAELAQRLDGPLDAEVLLSTRIAAGTSLPPAFGDAEDLKDRLAACFKAGRPLVLVMPVGAAVRLIAPLLASKHADPPVIVVDEGGRFAVPLVGSHEAGANALAERIANLLQGQAVITTAAEAAGTLALDLLAQRHGWVADPASDLTRVTALLVDGEPVGAYQDAGDERWWSEAPANLIRYSSLDALAQADIGARILITDRVLTPAGAVPTARYHPRTLAVGVGCVRGTTAREIEALVRESLATAGLSARSIACLATIEVKRDEPGIAACAGRLGVPVRYFSAAELSAVTTPSAPSQASLDAVGAPGVCEPAAVLAAGGGQLLVAKQKTKRVTVAVARTAPASAGSLALVGLGPGTPEGLTAEARAALEAADTVVGYELYVDMVRAWLSDKQYLARPIGQELERCREAIDLARAGRKVALVCSGDAGIYGMAGLVLELYAAGGAAGEADALQVVPGVTAGQTSAALLGAPLMSDYMTVSLSDLMMPWEVIRRRVRAAAEGDLVLVLYNPASRRRQQQLPEVVSLLLEHRPPDTPVGIVRQAGRPGQQVLVTGLGQLLDQPVDMLTTVVIGNSMTQRVGNRLFTRRGYPVPGSQGD